MGFVFTVLIRVLKLVVIAVLFSILLATFWPSSQSTSTIAPAPVGNTVTAPTKPSPKAWVYSEDSDPMGRGTDKYASVESTNSVDFNFPYQGSQTATLTLRKSAKYGNDVILEIKKGQFNCNYNGCNVTIRFDDGKAKVFKANEAADYSTNIIFIRGFSKIIPAIKASKTTRIEAEFYQEGPRVFEFNTEGLSW